MNYIQVNIGGKDRGLKFNQLALEEYTKNVGLSTATAIYATFYAGLMGNCYVKQEDPDFTFEQVCDWVDKMLEDKRKDEIEKVCALWAETNVYREWLKEFQDRLRALTGEKKSKKKAS